MARRRSVLVVGLVILLGALGTAVAAVALHVSARDWSERAFQSKQDVITQIVVAELYQYGVVLDDLAAALGAHPELTAAAFAAITRPIDPARLPGATAVALVVPASAATAARVQADWRERGSTGLTLADPAPPGEGYFPVLGRSLVAGGAPALGADLGRTGEITQALRRARPGTTAVASTAYGTTDPHFVMAAAVSGPDRQFRGWVTMTYRGRDFLGTPVGIVSDGQVGAEFADISGGQPVPLVAWPAGAEPYDALAPVTTDLALPQLPGHWRLTVRPTMRLLPATRSWLVPGAAAGGTLLTAVLAALAATLVTSRDRALRRVDEATAELRDDIARREEVEQQLRRREEELVGFAGVVAHDLRSPLATVAGCAEMMALAGDGMSDRQRGHLTRLRGSATRMQHLIDDLLGYAAAGDTALRITEIDLDELVDGVLAERLGAGTATVAKIDRAPLPAVLGDPSQIRQVLDNLIGNAIKYTPPDRPAEVSIDASPTESTLCRIEVADRGIGIPEHQRDEVFTAFTRAEGSERYQGTGLGLAIVRRIVERHGGEVGVEPNPGGGSRFWFTLPTPLPLPGSDRVRDGNGDSRGTFAEL